MIEQPETIRQILQHLELWESSQRAPPPRLFAHKLGQLVASLSPEQARQVQLSTIVRVYKSNSRRGLQVG